MSVQRGSLANMTSQQVRWQGEHSAVLSASPASIWRYFSDVRGWIKWNDGIEEIDIDGPFEVGTVFRMKPPGQDALTSVLVEVCPFQCFTDETQVGDLTVRVSHRIEVLGASRSRVTYAVEAVGEGADEIGTMVSGDFPEVLQNLAKLVESAVPSA